MTIFTALSTLIPTLYAGFTDEEIAAATTPEIAAAFFLLRTRTAEAESIASAHADGLLSDDEAHNKLFLLALED